MLALLNKPGVRSLILNAFIAFGAVLLLNGLIFGLGWNASPSTVNPSAFTPPDDVIGIVWEGLFALMGTARWLLNSHAEAGASQARTRITMLIGFCLLYPFYSLAIGGAVGGLLGNLGTILLSVFTATYVWKFSKPAAFMISLVTLWVMFATAVTLSELGWF
jgi:tryptophan-rich sensory protein